MSEFTFACSNCQQEIAVTSEYSGHQISCPTCQAQLIVPPPPGQTMPGVGTGEKTKLSMAARTAHQNESANASASYNALKAAHVKKKSKKGLIVGLSVGACVLVAAAIFGPMAMNKYKEKQAAEEAAKEAAEAAAKKAAEPPPELSTEEILQKVGDAYKNMTDYAAKGKTVADIDLSALVRSGQTKTHSTITSSMQLGRTNYYRLEWEQESDGKKFAGAVWNAGKGDYSGFGPFPPSKVKTRQEAMMTPQGFFLLSVGIADLFFNTTNSLATAAQEFAKTNGSNLNINGQDCYEIVGEENHQSVAVWVDKKTFLIAQIELTLGGQIDPAELKKMSSTPEGRKQRDLLARLSKLKGTVTETYDNIQSDKNLQASAFESSYHPTGDPNAARKRSMTAQQMRGGRQRGQP